VTAPATGQAANIPILMYHHLADLPANASELQQTWTVAPKNFEAQMNWLSQRGYHTITMAQLVAHLKRQHPLPVNPIVITFDDGWAEQYTIAFPILQRLGLIGTFFVYTTPIDRNSYLSWTQLSEMSNAAMDIQAHSLTHPHLRTLAPEEAFKEIAESKRILEKRLGKPVVAFNYPFGEYDNAVIDLVKRAGFESAVSLAAGYKQRQNELFVLHRIRVSYLDTLEDFAKRLPQ
jgi:peptidoglycan/xylan/chitin deacetylase (PgdA/CDA1 family)